MDTIVTPASIQQMARLEELLRRAGIGADEVQLLIDDVSRRNQVAQTWKYGDDVPGIVLPVEFDPGAMKKFIAHVFARQIKSLEWFEGRPGYELSEEGFDPMELAETWHIKDLLKGLDAAHVAVTVLRSGLTDDVEVKAAEVAERLGVPLKQVAKMRAAVTDHVRARQRSVYPFRHYERIVQPITGDSIESLGLSVRAYNILMRGDVRMVDKLTTMSHADLYEFRNVSQSVIDEIETALAKRGLSLA